MIKDVGVLNLASMIPQLES